MEPLNEKELKQLLRQWEAPAAPASLKIPKRPHRSRWTWLWNGSIRVPVPVGVAIVIVVALLGVRYSSRPAPPPVHLIEDSVTHPTPITPVTPDATAAPNIAKSREDTAVLAGFRPVSELKPRVIGGQQ